MADPADTQRLIGDLVREGVVTAVDHAARTCRVRTGDLDTGDIPWLAARVGATRIWSPPSIGEQVVILAPEGDTARAIVIGSIASDTHPHIGSDAGTVVEFADGTTIAVDPAAHTLTIVVPAGTVRLEAPQGTTIVGPLKVEGDVEITGKATASDDVIAAGKSLKSHKHTGVQSGAAVSGTPQ